MAYYRLVRKDTAAPTARPQDACDLYAGLATIAEIISDEEAQQRGLQGDDGFPADNWI